MVELLNNTFTDEETRWYIGNLYMYMNYHPTNDYPIDLENVLKMLGFAHKGNAKRTLEKNFIQGEDYKVIKLPRDKKQNAGRCEEQIMLNIDTFKNLCMLMKTEQGKKVRKYYLKLENIYNEIVKNELIENQKQLQEKEYELQNARKQLETKTKLAVKKWYKQQPGHVIYGFKSSTVSEDNKTLITIGKSKNISRRESEYLTHNQHGEMFFIRKCYNCDLAEKVLHHILDKYREERNKEWFDISEELSQYAIDTVCDFLDMFINSSENLPKYKIKEFLNNLPIEKFDTTVKFEDKTSLHIPDVVYNKNIKDYQRFIRELCTVDNEQNSVTLPYELTGAYRIWCKQSLSREATAEFKTYIYNNFEIKEKYFEHTGIRHKVITNLQLKKFEFIPDDVYNVKSYEKFCIESCITDYTYKLNFTEFIDNYTSWMKKTYPDYEMSGKHMSEIKEYFKRNFTLDNSMIYGIQLNTSKLPAYKMRDLSTVYMVNDDKEIVNTYNGLADEADKLNLEVKTVSNIIRYCKVIEYDSEKVTLIFEKEENVIKKRNMQKKHIYKYDYNTKQLLEKFDSTIEAANHFNITTNTVLRYINIAKVFTTKKDENRQILLSYLQNIHNVKPVAKTKIIKSRPCKTLYAFNAVTKELFTTYDGPFNAANILNIGQCTVHRHIKNRKPVTIVKNNERIPLIFSYTSTHSFPYT